MTLSDCVFLAVRNNRSIKSAYLERVAQKYDLRVAEDEFYPDLDITPAVRHRSSGETLQKEGVPSVPAVTGVTGVIVPGVKGEPASESINRSYENSTELETTVTQKIPTGGTFQFTWLNASLRDNDGPEHEGTYQSSWKLSFSQPLLRGAGLDVNLTSLRSARINEKINLLNLQSTLIDTVTSSILAYRSFIQAYEQLRITQRSVERAKALLEMNQALIEAGRMARVEIVQAEADLASRQFDLTSAENALDASRLALLQVLDMDRRTQIVPIERLDAGPVRLEPDEFQEIALENRTDYLQSLLNLDIQEMDLKVAKNNRLWDLSLDGSWGNDGEDQNHRKHALGKSQNTNTGDWEMGLSLTIPFGDLTREQAFIRAETNLKKARLSLEEQKENIEIEVMDAVRDVEMKLRQVELASQARELSERKLDIEQEKLKAGRSTNFQLVSYQNDLVSAQNNELSAKINYLNALTTLDQVLGTTLDTWKIEPAEEGY